MNVAFSMNKAVRLTRKMLFNPFSLKSWFFWALVVMLATGQFSINWSGDFSSSMTSSKHVLQNFFASDDSSSLPPNSNARVVNSDNPQTDISTTPAPSKVVPSTPTEKSQQHVIKFITIIIFILIFLPIGFLLFYIKCRFRFVLIDQCTRRTDAVTLPLREYREESKSFFKGQLLLFAIGIVFFLVTIFSYGFGFGVLEARSAWTIALGIVATIVLVLFSVLFQGYDSLGPVILYSDRSNFWQSFKKYLGFWRKHFGSLLVFGILKVFIYFSFFILILLLGIFTFNIALYVLMIPLVSIMICLPFYIFNQMFTLDFCNSLLNNPDWDTLEKRSQRPDTTPLTDIASNGAE